MDPEEARSGEGQEWAPLKARTLHDAPPAHDAAQRSTGISDMVPSWGRGDQPRTRIESTGLGTGLASGADEDGERLLRRETKRMGVSEVLVLDDEGPGGGEGKLQTRFSPMVSGAASRSSSRDHLQAGGRPPSLSLSDAFSPAMHRTGMRSQLTRIGSLFGNAPEIRAATAPAEARPRTAILQTPALDKHGHENHGWLTVRFVGFSLAAAPFTGEASQQFRLSGERWSIEIKPLAGGRGMWLSIGLNYLGRKTYLHKTMSLFFADEKQEQTLNILPHRPYLYSTVSGFTHRVVRTAKSLTHHFPTGQFNIRINCGPGGYC